MSYYKTVVASPLRTSAWFFIVWIGLTGLIQQGYQLTQDIPYWRQAARSAATQLIEQYPADLVLTWDGAMLKSTTDPLVVDFPSNVTVDPELAAVLPANLVTFASDASAAATGSAFSLSPTTLSLQLNDQPSRTLSLVDVLGTQPLTVTSATIRPQVELAMSQNLQTGLGLFALLSSLLYLISLYLSRLITVLLESALLTIVLSFTGLKFSYANVCKLSLHVVVLASMIEAVATVIDPTAHGFWFSLSYWLLMIYVLIPQVLPKVRLPSLPNDFE